jgi:hypothetical protein
LKETYEAYGKSGGLKMVGMDLDPTPGVALEYVTKNKMPWDQAWLGGDGGTEVCERYPGNGIPSIWLIGPDGVVIATGLRGNRIKSAVAGAMGK